MPRIVLTDMPPPSSSDAHSEVDVLFICKGRARRKILEIQNSAVSTISPSYAEEGVLLHEHRQQLLELRDCSLHSSPRRLMW